MERIPLLLSFVTPSPLHPVTSSLLFLGACLGHTGLIVFGHNWWYGVMRVRALNKVVRLLIRLVLLAGPLVFWCTYGLDLTAALRPPGGAGRALLAGYVAVCWVVGFVVVPAVTLRRRLGRPPAALLGNHTRTLDLAERLGYPPVGPGKRRWLARLPGNEIFTVDFAERTLGLPNLPAAWDGLTVLHLSDLHFCGTPDRRFFQEVMDLCRAWQPDLVAVTGDVVDSRTHHRWVVPVLGRLRWREAGFAILGNHDQYYDHNLIRRRLRRLGLDVLGNGWRLIEVRGEPLVVVGHEGPWFRPGPDLKGCPEGVFRLCLSHTPDNIRWARRNGIDLMLSGHNHGGQIRFPLIGSLFVPSRYSRRYDCGTFHEPPTLLHVSRGLGEEHPVRFNCRPEVTLLVLRPAERHPDNR